ncbi:MAG: HD domain-containing protein [Chitinophagales bacterium]|nr:HD domain-containing protein [Chitinophagales bacterium]
MSAIVFTDFERELFTRIGQCADTLNYPCFIMGGFVRDKLLHRPTKDMDIMVVGSGVHFAETLKEKEFPNGHLSVYRNFGTALIKEEGLEIEFVGARKESYRSNSRKPIVEEGSMEDDLSRRDFTINAMGICLNQDRFGELVDLFEGQKDLQDQIIRTPLEPVITFSDDPLRMLRAIRFATRLGFQIEENTWKGICESAERIKIISQERISDELNKIILCGRPSRGFELLDQCGLLQHIFPEFVALKGAEYVDGKGHKDNFTHTLQVLDNICLATDDLWLRWAAILHDIAKPATKRFDKKVGWTFHGHEVVGARMVPKIFGRLKLPLDEKMRFVKKLVFLHLRPISLTKDNITDSAIRRLLFEAGEDIDHLMKLCESDITSKNRQKVIRYLENFELVKQRMKEVEEKDHLRNWQPPVSGELIMKTFKINPGPIVGRIKDEIREQILDGKIPNTYEAAVALMHKLAAAEGVVVR